VAAAVKFHCLLCRLAAQAAVAAVLAAKAWAAVAAAEVATVVAAAVDMKVETVAIQVFLATSHNLLSTVLLFLLRVAMALIREALTTAQSPLPVSVFNPQVAMAAAS
jgi:hypothetical protein